MRAPAASSTVFLLSYFVLVSCARSFVLLLSHPASFTHLLLLLVCSKTFIALLSCPLPAPVLESPGVLLLLLMFGPVFPHLALTTLRKFKQALSNKFLHCYSSNFAKLLCPFPPFGLLPDKTNCKRTFNTVFINSCLFACIYS